MKISVMGIQISVTTIVTEIFIPVTWSKGTRKHDQKVGLDFVFWTIEKFQFHTQEGQDFSEVASVVHLITHTSSESRIVDLTNNGIVNHYLRNVEHGSHCLGRHTTSSFTYMSD